MIVKLNYTKVCEKNLNLSAGHRQLYGDFNVINYLYESQMNLPDAVNLYPDSTCVFFILNFFQGLKLRKIVSTDLLEKILDDAVRGKKKIYFFGGKPGTIELLSILLQDRYPDICIAGISEGYRFNSKDVIDTVNKSEADILFVGLGAGRQEKWILEHCNKINAKIIMSVGGWFSFLSGEKKRAPKFMQKIHFEWFYRLTTEFPTVWKRYIFGVPKFIYRVLSGKIILRVE